MRVALVHPAGSNWVPGKPDITTTANRMAPLGLLSLAAYLEPEHEVFVHDCLGPGAPYGTDENARRVLDLSPDLVGFSTTTSGFLDADGMAARIKERRPDVVTVFGGAHISALGAELLERFEAIDYLVFGEGEQTLAELASGADPRQIGGLAWRDGERIVTNPVRGQIASLDDLPFPAYEKLTGFPRGYKLPPFSYVKSPGATMITSRGCVYNCSFCDRSVFKRGFRYNSPDYIYEHMRYLRHEFGVRHINIYDDLFTTNRKRIAALCERLIREPLGIQFNCAIHAGHADDELLGMLHDAGCLMISVGIETGDPELLARHKPSITLEKVSDTVRRAQANGLRAKGLFIMGLPGETPETARRTTEFALDLGLDDMNISKFSPFHGAPCWPTIHEEGELEEDWRKMNCLNFVFVPEAFDSERQLNQLYNEHVKRFYSSSDWRRKLRRRLWQHRRTLWYLMANLPKFLSARRYFDPDRSAA
jgi:anaerobic magnesium-protoporphyrin IX monomethyl ester cyclase